MGARAGRESREYARVLGSRGEVIIDAGVEVARRVEVRSNVRIAGARDAILYEKESTRQARKRNWSEGLRWEMELKAEPEAVRWLRVR